MSDATKIKYENVQQVLQVFRSSDMLTKSEIARETGLTGVTVNSIVSRLEADGIVTNLGLSPSNGGRKASLFSINCDKGLFCGVSIRTTHIAVGLMDFSMTLKYSTQFEWQLGRHSVEETVNQIASFIKNITKEYGADKLLAVGINVPGPTDYQNGEVLSLRGFPTWKHIPLAKLLSDALGVSVTVDRDVNSGVELIKQIERLKGMMNMIYIAVDGGIGCGVMINGHTYRGNRGIAGEMGHITMMNNHQHCACGNVGSLKLSASDFAILRRCREILHLDESVPLSVDDAVQLYRDGNEEMIATFRLAVSNLAIAIRNVFMLYDPEVAYLRCRWLHTEDPLYFRLLEEVYIGNTLLEQNSIRIVLLNEDHFVLRSAGVIAWADIRGISRDACGVDRLSLQAFEPK